MEHIDGGDTWNKLLWGWEDRDWGSRKLQRKADLYKMEEANESQNHGNYMIWMVFARDKEMAWLMRGGWIV